MLDTKNKIKFKLFESYELSAKDNMQIDKTNFELFTENSTPIFRIYTWEKNSCTIGISQNFKNIKNLSDYRNNYTKRITGGGILFHGNDISYSLIIPSKYMKNLSVKESYEKISIFILSFYKSLGLDVNYAKDNNRIKLSKSEYCQIGFEPYDLILNGKKIGGNAQRRGKYTILQHGSIPIKSNITNENMGYSLEDFNINITINEARQLLIESFKNSFNIDFIEE